MSGDLIMRICAITKQGGVLIALEDLRKDLKRRGVASDAILMHIPKPNIRRAIVDGIGQMSELIVNSPEALQRGAKFRITLDRE
ncbi:hypothetical protein KKC88_04315 [Patescibacteria group bacterium]|nr:hypothetical protein [Patescibacteria group bacterium]MBU1964141.1 hypothetical protein [Patescibacteria group bacterium]